jgi:hypothetical protein
VPKDVGYLHLQPKYQKMDVGDILGLAFCPFGSSSKMAPCFKVVSTQHANFNQISYGRQKNGRLSLKLVNTMRDFSFQIRYLYGTSRDSLQSGGQGLANATAFSISPIETYIIWNVPVLTNYKAIHL